MMSDDSDPLERKVGPPFASLAVLVLALIATLGGVFGGPALGDHEAIVAQGARDMRLSGDWLVPPFLDTPFIRKPPLPYWLVAATSYVFPNDAETGLPVTATVARFPSALAALGTVLIVWKLASAMFGSRAGLVTAALAASSVFMLLYAPNATVEMLLTFCCTWAYAHFWFAVTARSRGRRRLHFLFFYLALGFGMMAKGPAPIPMVMAPLLVWWYTQRPLRVLARGGAASLRLAIFSLVRGLWPRTKEAFTRTWLLPGLVIFAATFVPWMLAVAARHPHAMDLWNWQYMQRAQGDYEDTRTRGALYYLPVVFGCLAPWLFLVFEAVAAPWLTRYARQRRGLYYAGVWAVMGVVIMSLMKFKKPYYIVPALPGFALLVGVVAERFYARPLEALRRRAGLAWGLLAVALGVGLLFGWSWAGDNFPHESTRLLLVGAVAIGLLLLSTGLYLRGRGWASLALTATTAVATFHLIWYGCGRSLDNVDRVADLARALDDHGIPIDATVMWADQRPDARLSFYFDRRTRHMVSPAEIVERIVDRSGKRGKDFIERMAVDRATELLSREQPIYLILERGHFERWKDDMGALGRLVLAVDSDPRSESDDWVVVTNGV